MSKPRHNREDHLWVVRRVFDCPEEEGGPVARWWLGLGHRGPLAMAWGEPEDAALFPRRTDAEETYRRYFGDEVEVQRLSDALKEVGEDTWNARSVERSISTRPTAPSRSTTGSRSRS